MKLLHKHVINKNVTSLYEDTDCKSIATQAILGAVVTLLEVSGEFALVRTADEYTGWVSRQHLSPFRRAAKASRYTVVSLLAPVLAQPRPSAELVTKLVLSCEVTATSAISAASRNGFVQLLLPDGSCGYIETKHLGAPLKTLLPLKAKLTKSNWQKRAQAEGTIGRQVVQSAKKLIGTPYLLGGCTPFTIDCSALTQLCYKLAGVQLLRDARLQINDHRFTTVAEGLPFASEQLRDGDLLFFESNGRIDHVAIALSDGRFIDSSGVKSYGIGVGIAQRQGHARSDKFVKAIRLI